MKNPELMRQLFDAILHEDIDTVKDIITQNEDININAPHPDRAGVYTPLIASIEVNCLDIFKYLINQGARAFIGDVNNKMPLAYAAESASSSDYLKVLLPLNPSVNHRDLQGKTALYHAVAKGRPIIELVKYGADVTIPDNEDNTPLDMAIANKDKNTAKLVFYFSLISLSLIDTNVFLQSYETLINSDDVLDFNHHYIARSDGKFDKMRLLQIACSPSTPFGWYLHQLNTKKAFEERAALHTQLHQLVVYTGYNPAIREQNTPVKFGMLNAYPQTVIQPATETMLKRMDEQDKRISALEVEVKRLDSKQSATNNFSI